MTDRQQNGVRSMATSNRRQAVRRCPRIPAVMTTLVCFAVVACWLAGCAAPRKLTIQRISSAEFPDFQDDMRFDGLDHCIRQSLAYLERTPPDRQFRFGDDLYSATHVRLSLETFLAFIESQPSNAALSRFIHDHYQVYRVGGSGRKQDVLFTGYYEPYLIGRRLADESHRVPILGRPEDLVTIEDLSEFSPRYAPEKLVGRLVGRTVVPYYDRREIEDDNVLDGKAPALAWLEDPVDLFFLQIQGSGRVYLDTGEILNVHYDSTNGRPYRSIGRLLLEEGKIPLAEMSMQRIRSYLAEHPEESREILNHNPSYVFFRPAKEGPLGFLDVKLTPGRSLALDYRLFPLPALVFIETAKPILDGGGRIINWQDFNRFVISQDTGGAIRGPGRADLFWGNGPYAEVAAGHMRQTGNLFLLVLKSEAGR